MRIDLIILLIVSVSPRYLTFRIDPKMEVVKLIRFSVALSQSFCRVETALPMAKDAAMKTSVSLSEYGKQMVREEH